jgi:acetate kinase
MKILAAACGSISSKSRLAETDFDNQLLVKGMAERSGQRASSVRQIIADKQEIRIEETLPTGV